MAYYLYFEKFDITKKKVLTSYMSNINNLGVYPRARSEDISFRVNGCMNGFTKIIGLDDSFTRL